ncbi:hypothetical protein HME9304_00437 [Flagellimonas maritima]|uniref:N-acetyltransferase domain-containing protein n=1 Tax=Flagellimonas maritima TaxID=1383885 RepID=A0A2Z4LNX8_9FLAO|nr:GNAT family N-acetyltransferase [Allomuricauda aurantiaca]AWX43449.1 hypothetical protein HME9304_00437 [Allomuricauda aurantiaca]
MNIVLELVSSTTINEYISVGTTSYNEHYLHLWIHGDSSPYIETSFTSLIVKNELDDENVVNFLVKLGGTSVGIVKLIRDCPLDEFSKDEALLIQKIYLLKIHSGKGIGQNVLQKIEEYAKTMGKLIVWLDTMQKGKPLDFYIKNGFQIKKKSELELLGVKMSEKAMWILTKQL